MIYCDPVCDCCGRCICRHHTYHNSTGLAGLKLVNKEPAILCDLLRINVRDIPNVFLGALQRAPTVQALRCSTQTCPHPLALSYVAHTVRCPLKISYGLRIGIRAHILSAVIGRCKKSYLPRSHHRQVGGMSAEGLCYTIPEGSERATFCTSYVCSLGAPIGAPS